MVSIVKKTIKQLKSLEERAAIVPSLTNSAEKKATVKVQVDASDEKNSSYHEEGSDIFSAFNTRNNFSSLRVDVKIDEDIEEDPSDAIAEGGKDTVYGQGTNPKPEDETYLSLLKKTTSTQPNKIKVKLK